MARPGSSVHVSQSISDLPTAFIKPTGSFHSAFAMAANVSVGISLCLMSYSSRVMSPMSTRPKSHMPSPPLSFHNSFTISTTASKAPPRIEPAVRVTASHHVRSGSFVIPAFNAVISRSPASLT